MIKQCPLCGSTEIVPDLLVFSDEAGSGQQPPYVRLVEPRPEKAPFIWSPKDVTSGFHAAVCGACGYTAFYTKRHAQILEAHKKGYTSQQNSLKIIPF
jgi:predicted nucleic-acid-binding Zn-ribbon protein